MRAGFGGSGRTRPATTRIPSLSGKSETAASRKPLIHCDRVSDHMSDHMSDRVIDPLRNAYCVRR